MYKTLRISFSLKNTYRVNSILYSMKQIPLIKHLLPQVLYQVNGLKILANIISIIKEVFGIFVWKLVYLLLMVYGATTLYGDVNQGPLFLHILLFLTIIGAFANTSMFNPTQDKYYAIVLMRMNAREYTLVNYSYYILKVILGFMPFTLLLGGMVGIPLWIRILLPFSVAGCKLTVAAANLRNFLKRDSVYNENKINKYMWVWIGLFLALAYGLPALGFVLPMMAVVVLDLLMILTGLGSIYVIYTFPQYKEVYQDLLSAEIVNPNTQTQLVKTATEKRISTDKSITSNRKGFEYLNELFIKRHKKILWNTTRMIAFAGLFLICGALLLLYLEPRAKETLNRIPLDSLPYFLFVMYIINRGTGFTQALFMNCDHSLLNYSFYKQPKYILKLFQIRLREIIKINAVPGLILGVGLAVILYASGGTDNPLNYVVVVVSLLCISLFFSVHYLTIYYLLQPYNAGTEIKSGTYQIVQMITYFCCFALMELRIPTLLFGVMCIVFCVLYCIIACILVYRLAPNTFKIRT